MTVMYNYGMLLQGESKRPRELRHNDPGDDRLWYAAVIMPLREKAYETKRELTQPSHAMTGRGAQ